MIVYQKVGDEAEDLETVRFSVSFLQRTKASVLVRESGLPRTATVYF
jgi:hypothetical protein